MNISNEMIKATMQQATYKRKEGTATSYYWFEGSRILPNRASIQNVEITDVARKGRNLRDTFAGQFIGKFTCKEQSPLKQYRPYVVRTQIWRNPDYPQFIGYGTLGISNEQGHVTDKSDTGDLIIMYSEDSHWDSIRIFYLAGMGKNPELIEAAYKYLSELLENK